MFIFWNSEPLSLDLFSVLIGVEVTGGFEAVWGHCRVIGVERACHDLRASFCGAMNNQSCLQWFCRVAFWEGVSTVILFGIAMPLKYFADMPGAVTYVGWVHGLLFMLYLGFLGLATLKLRWTLGRVVLFFIASLVPLAPFFVERSLRKEAILT